MKTENNQSKRTNEKWEINNAESLYNDIGIITPLDAPRRGYSFKRILRLELPNEQLTLEEQNANAEFILKAVNNHQKLLDVIRLMMICSNYTKAKKDFGNDSSHWTNIVEKVINEAE